MPKSPVNIPAFSRARATGGFTLVELLVVIGIIAILAGVAFGPITKGLETAKESAGMQTARTIALSEFQYSVDNGNFPGGAKSQDVASSLVQGGYIGDPSIFAASKGVAYNGTVGNIASMPATAICWDFMAEATGTGSTTGAPGLSTSDPDGLPVVASTGQDLTPPAQGPSSAKALVTTGPFGANGMAVCYKSNSAVFLKAVNTGGTPEINTSAANTLYNASFSTSATFTQLKPQ